MPEKKATIRDVAKLAEVSISSVSRYLADPKSVLPVAAYNIRNAVRELGFEPNSFARNLKRRRSNTVGIVVPYTNFFFGTACAVMSDYFYARKHIAYICPSDNDPDKERFFVQSLFEQHAAGLIITPTGLNTEFLRDVAKRHKNIVVMDRRENIGCDIVAMDFADSAHRLTRFVLENYPCDSVMLLMGGEQAYHMRECAKGIKLACREAGVPQGRVERVYDCYKFENVAVAVRRVYANLEEGKRPAIIAYGSAFLEFAIAVLNQCGPDALQRVDLAGFAMANLMNRLGIRLPCVMQNPELVATTASRLLFEKISGTEKVKKRGSPQYHEVKPEFRLEK